MEKVPESFPMGHVELSCIGNKDKMETYFVEVVYLRNIFGSYVAEFCAQGLLLTVLWDHVVSVME